MLGRVALVRTDVSEERSASFIRVTRIGELGPTLAVTSNRSIVRRLLVRARFGPTSPILVILMKEALNSSETSVLIRTTRRNITEDAILHNNSVPNFDETLILPNAAVPNDLGSGHTAQRTPLLEVCYCSVL
jgi:hypothetical protein